MLRFYIAGVENADGTRIYLDAHARDGYWNGWEVPHATFAQLAAFIEAAGFDGGLMEHEDGLLTYTTDWREDDCWEKVGTTRDGEALYELDGWMWDLAAWTPKS